MRNKPNAALKTVAVSFIKVTTTHLCLSYGKDVGCVNAAYRSQSLLMKPPNASQLSGHR